MEISLATGISFVDGPLPIADVVAGVMIIGILYNEHTKNKSNQEKHESGNARRQRDQGGEKKKQKANWVPKKNLKVGGSMNFSKFINKKIAIYKFSDDRFIVGEILNVNNKEIMVKCYDTNNIFSSINIMDISKIKRISIESNYVNNLENVNRKITINKFFSEGKIFIKLKSGETITVKNIKAIKDYYVVTILDENLEFESKEYIVDELIECMMIESEGIGIDIKLVEIETFSDTYFGDLLEKDNKFIYVNSISEFSKTKKLLIIPVDNICRIKEISRENVFSTIEEDILMKIMGKSKTEIISWCIKNNVVVSLQSEYWEEDRVGIITNMNKGFLRIKVIDRYGNINIEETIQMKEIHIFEIKAVKIEGKTN